MFGRVVCINLDDRPDRWALAQQAHACLGEARPLERFSAARVRVCGNDVVNGRAGCLLSHRRAIEAAHRDGVESLLVFEDDVEFTREVAPILVEGLASLAALPWDMAFFGLEPRAPLFPVAPRLARVLHGATTHAVAYHRRLYPRLLAALPEEDGVLEWLARHTAVDRYYCDILLPRIQGYAIVPFVAHQRAGYSDVEGMQLPPKAEATPLASMPRFSWAWRRSLWEVLRPVRWLLRRERAWRFRAKPGVTPA